MNADKQQAQSRKSLRASDFSQAFLALSWAAVFDKGGLFSVSVLHFHQKPLQGLDCLCLCEAYQSNTARNFTVTWFSTRLDQCWVKRHVFIGEKIPVQFHRLIPYKLYFFAIHQTPCSLCISRLLSYSVRIRQVLQTAGGTGWNTGYQWHTQRYSRDVLCNPVLFHPVNYAQASRQYLLMRDTVRCWAC